MSQEKSWEAEVIDFALGLDEILPEPLAAGYLFFRFDPEFRRELDAARDALALDTGRAVPHEDWAEGSPAEMDAALEIALGIAARWGLDPNGTRDLLLRDQPVTYPDVVLCVDCVDEVTGRRFTRIDVYSQHAWTAFDRAYQWLLWKDRPPSPQHFADDLRPMAERSRRLGRIANMSVRVARRTLAVYYMTTPRRGLRVSGGRLSLLDAQGEWSAETSDPRDTPLRWRQNCERLLGQIEAHRPNADDAFHPSLPAPGIRR